MMTNKITADTNVVIAAGIIQSIGESDIVVKHGFYYQPVRLRSLS